MELMLDIEGLSFRHSGSATWTLDDISLSVGQGEVLALLGPNGSGKTTLLNCAAGLLRPDRGRLRLSGHDLNDMPVGDIARHLAMVPQENDIPFPYAVADVVLMGRAAHVGLLSAPGERDREIAHAAMETMGIVHLARRPFTRLSGGERQLALVARALAQEAPILLLDEPTSHLDLRNQLSVMERIVAAVDKHRLTVLMTVHDPNLALSFAGRVVLLSNGRLWGDGTPPQMITGESMAAVFGVEAEIVEAKGRRVLLARSCL